MARVRPIKSPATAAERYGLNGSSANATADWAKNFSADIPAILDAAAKAIPRWQEAVSTVEAAHAMQRGLTRAKSNSAAIAAKVNGVGKQSFAAGVRAASTGHYLAFANEFMPAVANQVATLDRTHPRGNRADNRARQAAYDTWIDSQAGKFRVK